MTETKYSNGETHCCEKQSTNRTQLAGSPQKQRSYRGIALLGLAGVTWEEDELGSVLLQPLHILLQTLHGAVAAAVVHSNANASGLLLVDLSALCA